MSNALNEIAHGIVSNPMRVGLSLSDATEAVLRNVVPLPTEQVALETACGRALASAVVSPIDLPLWDNSGMDGYAVRRADVLGANTEHPIELRVLDTIMAGSNASPNILPFTCARIMTGAPVPPGADAVIRIEDTDRGEATVRIVNDRDARSPLGNVRARGEDIRHGQTVFELGTTLLPVHLGVLASVGVAQPLVHRAPRVVVVSTGDELVRVEQFDQVLAGRRIVSSSSYTLPAWLMARGATVRALPLLPDDLAHIQRAIGAALEEGCDLLVTTGGVSVGAHDYTRDALTALGAEMDFWRARIRPGGPIGIGRVRDTPWIGLPGNPVSTMVTAELFVRPALRRLGGHANVHNATIPVRAGEAMKAGGGLTHLLRAVVKRDEGGALVAHLAGAQGSNLLRTMTLANALLVIPEGYDAVEAGDVLDAMIVGELQ